MKSIWKFRIPATDKFMLSMPRGAEIIAFQAQDDKPYIWAIVDQGAEDEKREFILLGTGHEFEKVPSQYIGTAQILGGALVWHLFEIKEGK